MSTDNDYDDDDDNNTPTPTPTARAISPEEQNKLVSEAVAKESAAKHKETKAFSELATRGTTGGAGEELKHTVRLLAIAEQTDVLTAVLTRLDGDRNAWETVQRQPVALITMILEEQQRRMTELQSKLKKEESKKKNMMIMIGGDDNDDNDNKNNKNNDVDIDD